MPSLNAKHPDGPTGAALAQCAGRPQGNVFLKNEAFSLTVPSLPKRGKQHAAMDAAALGRAAVFLFI